MADTIIAGLDIGTAQTTVCVGAINRQQELNILGFGSAPSAEIRKGQVCDIPNARSSVIRAIEAAEEASDCEVIDITLGVGGGQIIDKIQTGYYNVGGAAIEKEDMEAARENARTHDLVEGYTLLHTLDRAYGVDDRVGIVSPLEMGCQRLSFEALHIYAKSSVLDDLASVVNGKGKTEVADTVFSGIAAAGAVLDEDRKRNGVLLIDLGAGTTDYIVYTGGLPTAVGSLALGGEHVTSDIMTAFSLGKFEAERAKIQSGQALVDGDSNGERVQVKRNVGFDDISINRRALHTVINARMDEILSLVRDDLAARDLLPLIGSGVVLVGGGAYMPKITTLASNIFARPCVIGEPLAFQGAQIPDPGATWAVALGLVKYAWKLSLTSKGPGIFDTLFGGFFGGNSK